MEAGQLKDPVIIQTPTQTATSSGSLTQTWAQFKARRARVRPLSGQSLVNAQSVMPQVSAEIDVRYEQGYKAKMRVLVPSEYTTLGTALASTATTTVVPSDAAGLATPRNCRIKIDNELMTITAGHGTTSWTVTRASDGTTAATHAADSIIAVYHPYSIEAIVDQGNAHRELRLFCKATEN